MSDYPIPEPKPGPLVLFGSGETSSSGRKIFDAVLRELPPRPRIALLETPAGFEPNSRQVIGRVESFIEHGLQNYEPQVSVVAARRRGTESSPDNPQVVAPLLEADAIFMGPGSPSYAVRQLRDSLAWEYIKARHSLGAPLILASSAVVAVSCLALPVYEIYKVGEDLHWKAGLDFLGPYGLRLVFVPHWNNQDGGEELDTSCCFMGKSRFARLVEMLPQDTTIVGIDEKTALIVNLQTGACRVLGLGGVTLIRPGEEGAAGSPGSLEAGLERIPGETQAQFFLHGSKFSMGEVFSYDGRPPGEHASRTAWQVALKVQARLQAERQEELPPRPVGQQELPEEIGLLIAAREKARSSKDWAAADSLREQILALGWSIVDGPEGPAVKKI